MKITTADALEILALVAACHHRTAPRLDDREAALALATVWADLFNELRLDKPDVVAAVKKRALTHAEAPEPADIITLARKIRCDRLDREDEQTRQAREDAYDAALAARNQARLAVITGAISEARSIDREPHAADTAIPLCRVCGARPLLAIHEAARGICDWCTPAIGDPQPHPNGDSDTA
jgi:hypothetical protein